MITVGLACLAALLFGAMLILMRWGVQRRPSAGLGALGMVVAALAVALLLAALAPGGGPAGTPASAVWPLLVSGALVPGVSHILFVRAVHDAGPSRAAIVVAASPLLSVVLSLTLLGEPFHPAAAVGALIIVTGAAALSWERVRPPGFRAVGMLIAAVVALLFAVRDNLVRFSGTDAHLPPALATAVILAAALPVVGGYLLVTSRPGPRDLAAGLRAFAPAGAFFGGGYVALVAAFDHGRVSVVSPLNATQSLWAMALSALLLGRAERLGPRVLCAGVLVVAGAATIGATR